MKAIDSTGIIKKDIQVREGNDKQAILKEAVDRSLIGYDYHRENMERAERNLLYIAGEQYTQEELREKELDNRIAMTFNKLPQFINKVTGSQRSTVQTIKITPTGRSIGKEEPKMETGQAREAPLSDILTDVVREIEYSSNAKSHYKTAFKHALEGGFGWLRVLTEYQEDGFDLDIKIAGQRDRWSVIVDPKAVEQDMSDMNWCFISERISIKEFEKRYKGKSHEALPGSDTQRYSTFWGEDDTVTVTEYFRREPITKEIILMSDGKTYDAEDVDPLMEQLAEQGIEEQDRRKVQSHKVIWCKISQGDILEEEIEFPTTTIPVVPVMGREIDFRGKRVLKGLIDDGIDAQIALNRMRSSAIERIDASPLAPFIASDKAIEGYENMWADANTVRYSTLVYRKGEERPTREQGSTIPTAELQVTSVLDNDMKASIGMFNASLGETSNEISGKAIKARQQESDVGTYEFIDNYENAIRRVGLLVTEMIPKVYDTERILRIRGADGMTDTIEINKVIQDPNTGDEVVINALDHGKYTVVIGVGASYETKAEQNAEQILDLMKVNPQVSQVGSDLLVKNLDFADSDVLSSRLERMIPKEFLSKQKQEELAKDAPEPQPSPEQIEAQAEQKKSELEMQKLQMELEAKTRIEEIKLETAQVNLQIKREELQNKANEDHRNMVGREEDRKDKQVEGIMAQIKNSKSKTSE